MLFLVGCNKPDPNPELLDPIYRDLEKERKDLEAALISIKAEVAEYQKNLERVEPHTGQIHYARKRLYDAEKILETNIQRHKYLKVRLESRKDEVFLSYMKAFREKRPWPDPKEYADFNALREMRSQPPQWRPRERLEKYQNSIGKSNRAPAEKETTQNNQ
jgi:hypothetical protein